MSTPDDFSPGTILAVRRLVVVERAEGVSCAIVQIDRRDRDGHALAIRLTGDRALDRDGLTTLVDTEDSVRGFFGIPESLAPLLPGERLTVVVQEGRFVAGGLRLADVLGTNNERGLR